MKKLNVKGVALGLLAALFIPMAASAQDDETKLVIYGSDGKPAREISIYDIRKITFQESSFTMVMEDGAGADEQFAYDDVRKMNFSGTQTGIGSVKDDAEGVISISRRGDVIVIEGVEGSAHVGLFDTAGRQMMSRTIRGCAEISTADLKDGVYIMRVNNKVFKFSKF